MSDQLSQSTCLEMYRKTDEHVNHSVEVHRLVGKLSTDKTILTEVQLKFPTCASSFLVIYVCNQGNTLCSPCIATTTSITAPQLESKLYCVLGQGPEYYDITSRADCNSPTPQLCCIS